MNILEQAVSQLGIKDTVQPLIPQEYSVAFTGPTYNKANDVIVFPTLPPSGERWAEGSPVYGAAREEFTPQLTALALAPIPSHTQGYHAIDDHWIRLADEEEVVSLSLRGGSLQKAAQMSRMILAEQNPSLPLRDLMTVIDNLADDTVMPTDPHFMSISWVTQKPLNFGVAADGRGTPIGITFASSKTFTLHTIEAVRQTTDHDVVLTKSAWNILVADACSRHLPDDAIVTVAAAIRRQSARGEETACGAQTTVATLRNMARAISEKVQPHTSVWPAELAQLYQSIHPYDAHASLFRQQLTLTASEGAGSIHDVIPATIPTEQQPEPVRYAQYQAPPKPSAPQIDATPTHSMPLEQIRVAEATPPKAPTAEAQTPEAAPKVKPTVPETPPPVTQPTLPKTTVEKPQKPAEPAWRPKQNPPSAPARENPTPPPDDRPLLEILNDPNGPPTVTIAPSEGSQHLPTLLKAFTEQFDLSPDKITVTANFRNGKWNITGAIPSEDQTIALSLKPDAANGFAVADVKFEGFGPGAGTMAKIFLTPKRILERLNMKLPKTLVTKLTVKSGGTLIFTRQHR